MDGLMKSIYLLRSEEFEFDMSGIRVLYSLSWSMVWYGIVKLDVVVVVLVAVSIYLYIYCL